MINQRGLTDIPAEDDIFEIGPYIDGLVEFIKECRTPMTISIQGTWGTGKTSIMRMICKKINPDSKLEENQTSKSDYKCVYFNAWEFSQFNLSDSISFVMIQQLTNALVADDKTMDDAFRDTFGRVLGIAVEIGAGYLSGGAGINTRKEDLDQLKELKNEFQILINKKLGLVEKSYRLRKKIDEDRKFLNIMDPYKRVVFFIDDLDRLNPEKAVEVLEVLKNFLDCNNCVFILAIDYDVVCRGVAGKYNYDPDDPKNIKKGKDFFDKIIQVPFKMPVEQYNITAYIKNLLDTVIVYDSPLMDKDENYEQYEDLVKASIGTNPRAIKRLINSFQLLSMVVSRNKSIDLKKSKLLLFATLCLQELDLNVYRAITRKREMLKPKDLQCFVDGSDAETIERVHNGIDMSKLEADRIGVFINLLIDILDTDKNNQLTEDELLPFSKILRIAAVTGNDAPVGDYLS